MSRRYTFVLPPLVLGLLLSAGPVAARQMDARSSPRVRGPLAQIAKDCKSRRERFRGRVIAVARSCVRFYTLAGDSNARRDYGVIWLHTTVDSRRSWCTTRVRSDINIPDGTRLHERSPRLFRAGRRRRVTTRLVVDAAGFAESNAVVSKRFTMIPRRLQGARAANGRIWRAVWRGSSPAIVGAASGAEISWPQSERPPTPVTSGLRYEVQSKPRC
jgi:hypothetical protein